MNTILCRFCGKELHHIFVNLGKSPLANSFVKKESQKEDERNYPLIVYLCKNCLLVQLEEFEKPQKIFSNYAYFSSFSDTWLEHARRYTNFMIKNFEINQDCLVTEIASNDGYLLQYFKEKGIKVLGIEPASNVAKIAKQKDILTEIRFFDEDSALELTEKYGKADLIIANNVIAHVPNLNSFVKGMKIFLKPNGIITIEFPHLLNLIKYTQFDTIYHEHFSYFSLLSVKRIFEEHKMKIFDVEKIHTHGGSLRIFVTHINDNKFSEMKRVRSLLVEEENFGLKNIEIYNQFSEKVLLLKESIRSFFEKANRAKKSIVGYGAPAKANTLLNFCDIGREFFEYVVDKNPHKQGLCLPGTHIPIENPEKIKITKPHYLVIFPWNLKDEIMKQMSFIKNWGGQFVILVPELKIL